MAVGNETLSGPPRGGSVSDRNWVVREARKGSHHRSSSCCARSAEMARTAVGWTALEGSVWWRIP